MGNEIKMKPIDSWDIGVIVNSQAYQDCDYMWLITTETGRPFVLKCMDNISTKERLERDYGLLLHLHEREIPVTLLLMTKAGTCCAEVDDGLYILYEFLPGEPHGPLSEHAAEIFNSYGMTLARLHAACST
jgi:Ser/Thr protein kinase RdoA (MazF antagonist)